MARWPWRISTWRSFGGEIVCIAGVQGNGQTELAEALLGVTPVVKGSMQLDGRPLTGLTPRETIDAGLGFVPEDRKQDGCVGTFTVAENLILNHFDEPPYARGIAHGSVEGAAERHPSGQPSSIFARSRSRQLCRRCRVAISKRWSWPVSSLALWALLVACQPTRGLDVGAIEFVHKRLIEERDRGTAVVIVSTELDEVVALADRIAVMYRGRIVGIVPPDTSREVLGLLMAGVPTEEALASASRTTLAEEDADNAGPVVRDSSADEP